MNGQSDSITKISAALIAASKNLGAAKKGATNPFFKSKYANLSSIIEVVKEPLEQQGIIILQPMEVHGEQTFLRTILLHSSGEYLSSSIPLSLAGKEQEIGSRISYLRRYQLQAMLSIPAVDDDAEATIARPEPTTKKTYKRPTRSN